MKWATILLVLLSSASALGQKFEVSDLSAADSPVSFRGMAKVFKTGTACTVTMHNNSAQSLLAIEVSGEVMDPYGMMMRTGWHYDGFFKETGFPPGEDFELVGPDFGQPSTYINGVLVPEEPKKDLVCHAEFKVQFFQFEDGSTSGDYQTQKDVMARREKQMAFLSHLIEVYDTSGEAAFAAAIDELLGTGTATSRESRSWARLLNETATYYKVPLIDLVRKKLAYAVKRHASGIF